jgi:hypothetical protein
MSKFNMIFFFLFVYVYIFFGTSFARELPEGVTDNGSIILTISGSKPKNLIFSVTMQFMPNIKPIRNVFQIKDFTDETDKYCIELPVQLFHPDKEYRLLNIIVNATVKYKKETLKEDLNLATNVFELAFHPEAAFERRPSLREKAFFPDFPAELDLICEEAVFAVPERTASILSCTYEGKVQQSSHLPLSSLDKNSRMTLNFIVTGQKKLD